jgi:hypothetical protein
MLNLTSQQQELISSAGAALPPRDRQRFEQRVLEQLATAPEIGDGLVHRLAAQTQREMLVPPSATECAFEPQHRKP